MKKISTNSYKKAYRFNTPEEAQGLNIEQLPVPDKIKWALTTALHECEDPYCQTYIRALPKTVQLGKQMDQLDDAIRTQINYIYANMEDYDNEEVKTVLANWLNIPPEYRHGAEEENDEGEDDLV
jgi:hypothetical protein